MKSDISAVIQRFKTGLSEDDDDEYMIVNEFHHLKSAIKLVIILFTRCEFH